MLARRTATEIGAGKEDGRALETRIVERMRPVGAVGILAHVVEQEFAEPVERDALHEARRDDAVGVDVVAGHVNAPTGDLGDFCERHGERKRGVEVESLS